MCEVIWYSAADGSWGGCDVRDLYIIGKNELTTDEWSSITESDDAEFIGETICLAYNRVVAEQARA